MLTSRSEKELFGEFERQRNLALKDSSSFAASGEEFSLDDLGVDIEGNGVNDSETYLIDSSPVDNYTPKKSNAVDIRQIPGHD